MKKYLLMLACIFYLSMYSAGAQMTQITGSNIRIGSGVISSGTICAVAVDANSNPITVAIGGGGMQGVGQSCASITAGVITTAVGGGTYTVADENLAGNSGFYYNFTVKDTSVGTPTSGQSFQMLRVPGVKGATFALDQYVPITSVGTLPVFSFSTGSGAPVIGCAGKSFYQDNSTPTSPVLYSCGGDGAFHAITAGDGNGVDATIAVGSTATGAAGTQASVTNVGTSGAAVLNFSIPQGVAGSAGATGPTGPTGATGPTGSAGSTGTAATIAVGTVTTGSPGSSAVVTNAGSSSAAVLNFTIPQGAAGTGGGLTSNTVGNLAPLFTATLGGSPLTAPSLTFTPSVAAQNAVFAGPSSGGSGAYSFRALVASDMPAYTGDVTSTAGSGENTLATVNSNVGSCGDATHVPQVTLNAKGLVTACAPVAVTGGGGLADPGSNGLVKRTGLGVTAPATASDVQTTLASDTVNNTAITFSPGSGGDSTVPSPVASKDILAMIAGSLAFSHNGLAFVPFSYFDVTSSIQTQLNAKAPTVSPTFTGTVTLPAGAALNTPASATLTNATGLPLTTGVTGLLPHANIAATAVTPGSYTNANITIAADGSVTAASNGSGGGASLTYWSNCYGDCSGGWVAPSSNEEELGSVIIPSTLSIGHIVFEAGTGEATSLYSFGIFGPSGTLLCHTAPAAYATAQVYSVACIEGTVTVPAGKVYIGYTTNSATPALSIGMVQQVATPYAWNNSFTTTTGGAQPASITAPADSPSFSNYQPAILLEP